MPSDSGNHRPLRTPQRMGHPPSPQTSSQPCPRCDSTNTKFCYYNNYNLSQPRHFCKSCRRYWTQGGTLRDIPVGGGSRKNNHNNSNPKRSRSSSNSSPSSSSSANSCSSSSSSTQLAKPLSVLPGLISDHNSSSLSTHNESMGTGNGSFTSLLGGYGSGLSSGFDEMGLGQFGFASRGVWSYPEAGDILVGDYCSGSGAFSEYSGSSGYHNTWRTNGTDQGVVDEDGFAWPELSISMHGGSLK